MDAKLVWLMLASEMQVITIPPILKKFHAMNWQQQIHFMEVKERKTIMKEIKVTGGFQLGGQDCLLF